jgi:hypothetical protein
MIFDSSKHATQRMQQRGMRLCDIALATSLFDFEVAVGRGMSALRLSRRALREAQADGVSAEAIARIARTVLVASDDGTLVTCARLHGPGAGNYTRRDRRKYWRT